jgi:rhodanese-related sulfurtransferase
VGAEAPDGTGSKVQSEESARPGRRRLDARAAAPLPWTGGLEGDRKERPMGEIKRISPEEASRLLVEGYTYVDVRTVEEYAAGHPAGSVNVPIVFAGNAPNPDFARVMKAAFPKDAKIIVGCKAGGRSARAAQALAAEGFTNVVDQRAGWEGARDPFGQLEPGWAPRGLPSEAGQPADRSWEHMKAKA